MGNVSTSLNKRALLVGVNKYPNLPDFSQLRGCVNDVHIMRQTLETSFGFLSGNIVVLLDEQATAKGIRDAMEKLVVECQPDDIAVFHYSGHGSQMIARGDKPRGYDESIMPYDSGRMNAGFPKDVPPCDIRDTDIQEWLSRLTQKTSHVTLIFDSCHSGSITRMQSDSEEQGTRLRWVPPDPLPAENLSAPKPETGVINRDSRGSSGWLPSTEDYVLLAACAAEQGAYEMDHEAMGTPSRNGAFTFFLTQELSQASQSTYQDIWDIVAIKVNNRFQKQTPQLEGARDRQIFDVHDFVPMRYLLVTHRQDDVVQLAGGAIHGVTAGSQWEIYPAGTREVTESGNTVQGAVEITAVQTVTATGRITKEVASGAIAQSARAVEVIRVDGERRMAVWFDKAPTAYERYFEELRSTLAQSPLLTVTDSVASARVLLKIDFQNDNAGGANTEPKWDVFDQSQARLMAQSPLTSSESRLKILENLEALWRYEKVLELRNEQSMLKGKVSFVLLKKDSSNQWQEVTEPEEPVYREGDEIAFRVANRSGIPLHISVLDLGLSKRISLLYPSESASETLATGRSGGAASDVAASGVLSVGERPEDEIELWFPDNLTFLPSSSNGFSRGKEIFKLCVTTARHDLACFKQAGVRNEAHSAMQHPLEELMYLATGNGVVRETRRRLEPHDEWFTIERAFWLEKKQ